MFCLSRWSAFPSGISDWQSSGPVVAVAGTGTIYLESKDIDFGKPQLDKSLEMLRFDLAANGQVPTFKIQIGWRNNLNDAITWADQGYVTLDNPVLYTIRDVADSNHVPIARFFKLKLIDENPIGVWFLTKIEAYGSYVGQGRF